MTRIKHHPILGTLPERKVISFSFNAKVYEGYEQDTIASALLANGIRTLREHEASGNPRGIYCNIGHCFECRCTVDKKTNVRACLTPIKENMQVKRGDILPDPLNPNQTNPLPKTYEEYDKLKGGQQDG